LSKKYYPNFTGYAAAADSYAGCGVADSGVGLVEENGGERIRRKKIGRRREGNEGDENETTS